MDDQLCISIETKLRNIFKSEVAKEGLTMSEVVRAMIEAYVQGNEAIRKEVRYRIKR